MPERLSPEKQAILRALRERGPMSPDELGTATGQPTQATCCRLRAMADQKLIALDADNVARLPHQPPPPRWMPDDERVIAERREAWLQRGIVIVHPDELPDAFLRQQLYGYACQRYGRRRAVRAR